MFEVLVISWLQDASLDAVRVHLGRTCYEVDAIMKRALERGLVRRKEKPVQTIGVDEFSDQKRMNP